MKAALALLWILSLVAAFGLARLTLPERAPRGADGFRAALEEPDPLERSYRLSAALRELGPDDLPAILEEFEARESRLGREEVRLLMLAWTRFDAPAAFAWARDRPTLWKQTLMDEAISAWGFRDGRAALGALEGIEDAELEARLRGLLLTGWMRSDAREGIDTYLAELANARQRNRLTMVLTGEIMKQGAPAVMRWAEALPEDLPNEFKRLAFFHAASVVAQEDPRRAAAWFEVHRTRPYTEQTLEGIALAWAQHHDPPALFEWLKSLDGAGARPGEVSEAMLFGYRAWQRRAPEEAEAWLRSALPHPELDSAVAHQVRRTSQSSGRSAIEWAALIQDQEVRQRSLQLAAGMWLREDPEAARAWLEQSDLPEASKRAILSGPPALARRRPAPSPAEAAAP